jgi:site-specific recombinase XerD
VDTRAAVDSFLESPAHAESTRRAYRIDLEEFEAWLDREGLELSQFDARAFADYLAELGADRPGRTPRKLS